MVRTYINKFKIAYYNWRYSRNNHISIKGRIFNTKLIILGKNNTVIIREKANIENATIFIKGNNQRLIIGRGVRVKSGLFWLEHIGNIIEIGENTSIENAHVAATEYNHSIKIGEDCMLSHGISIRNGDSHSIYSTEDGKRINCAKNILIGNHVWIGADVVILKGAKLGANCVVGIKSVVTGSFSDNNLIAGMPARVIKSGVSWTREII